ncbi:MAG: hypothetical protein RLZZ579_86 [Actinomycetota bacterium]
MSEPSQPVTLSQTLRKNWFVALTWVVGNLLLIAGLISVAVQVVGFFVSNRAFPGELLLLASELLTGLTLVAVSFLFKIPIYLRKVKNTKRYLLEEEASRKAAQEAEMTRIRESMTPAEWELYKVQLENQKLLKEIKNKPNTGNSGPRAVYGFVNDISD